MNLLDKIVAAVAPVAGVKRAQARLALEHARAYEAAKTGRRTAGWTTPSSSANTEIGPALERVRNRARDLVRNNEYAARAISVLTTSIVGTGIQVGMGKSQDLWNRWVDECDADGQLDLNGIQALVARCWKESGETLVRLRYRKPDDGLSVPLQLQVLEPDYLITVNELTANGNVIIAGVEYDLLGRRVAYHMWRTHPGETGYNGSQARVRIPATDILHVYQKDRPQQVRGMPALAVSMMRTRDLSDYEDAELVRKKIEACFSVFVRTDDPVRTIGAPGDTPDARRIEKLAPGMINYVKGSEEITFANPQANGAYGEYTRTQLHAIAVGAGVTYQQLTGDLSQANFSSMRGGRIEFNALIDQAQWLTFIPMFMKPVIRAFGEAALLVGKKDVKGITPKFTTPKRPFIDPVKEVLALKEQLASGMISPSEVIRSMGYDPQEVWEEIKRDTETMQKLGISPDKTAGLSLKEVMLQPNAAE
ncbi:phage portal protein, lambda family [Noviherbaspirillum humi]|uniref:Phage portal protein, lambda family n=1 Tax=Noviherbaspirillum humi TaxID=1688639 RepID=A0A239LH47_9BURK|nr:phage portal protein [Noviherbaspirillum humi]SNT28874.1 phage portal protein, lambda family [Noviherbaspirillum humi]